MCRASFAHLRSRRIASSSCSVGRKIFTKRVGIDDDSPGGLNDAEDIIDQYKNKEGTDEERMSVLNAARSGGLSFLFELPPPGKEDVDFDLLDIQKVLIGQPFTIVLEMSNRSGFKRSVTVVINANTVYYTGILARKVKRERHNFLLQPYQSKSSLPVRRARTENRDVKARKAIASARSIRLQRVLSRDGALPPSQNCEVPRSVFFC